MRFRFASLLALALVAMPAAAQDLLPGGFALWTPARVEKFSGAQIEVLAGENAAILREYGCRSAERRAYRRDTDTLTVVAYRMNDPTAAYGAFTFLRTADMAASSVADLAASSPGTILAVAGDLLLEFRADGMQRFEADLRALIADLTSRANAAPFPTLAQHLPEQGRVRNSERYILGRAALARLVPLAQADWIGFDGGAEVQLADYRVGNQHSTLVLALYPTPQAAAARLDGLRRWFNVNAEEEVVAGRPVVFARRSSSLLGIALQASSRALAESLLSQVQYQSQVTWNEPAFSATEPTWGEMIVVIFYGTGIILMFALVAGLAFGGVRLMVKRLLPGKVFDRDSSVEILQLGLGSKPIEGKDFYSYPASKSRN